MGGRLILKFVVKKQDGREWTGFLWLKMGTSGGSCEHGNEPCVFVRHGNFLVVEELLDSEEGFCCFME